MNNAKRTKNLIEMYSEDLAANLAKEDDISEVTVFWEVPYHLEGQNIAKFTYTKSGEGMAIGERWYDPSLKEVRMNINIKVYLHTKGTNFFQSGIFWF